MRGHPDLAGEYRVADEIIAGLAVSLPPELRLWLYEKIAKGIRDEREACAKVAEASDWGSRIADAIRAR